MLDDLCKSVFPIKSSSPEKRFCNTIGTGFIIYKDAQATYLLTCAHVVRDVGGENHVLVGSIAAKVIASGEKNGFDIAVLQVEGNLDKPPLKLSASAKESQRFLIIGCYEHSKGSLARREISGNLGKPFQWEPSDKEINGWVLKINGEDVLQPGYSGSPVVDEETGYVIGIVNISLPDGQKGEAISIEEIKRVWPDMPSGLFQTSSLTQKEKGMIQNSPPQPVGIYISFYRSDIKFCQYLEKCLSLLETQGKAKILHHHKFTLGSRTEQEIETNLASAKIILILVTTDYINHCLKNLEFEIAIKQHQAKTSVMIPVIIEDCLWDSTILKQFEVLPRNREAVTNTKVWRRKDAFFHIAQEVHKEVERFLDNSA